MTGFKLGFALAGWPWRGVPAPRRARCWGPAQEVTERVGFQPGVPVKPMLAKPTTGVSEARPLRPPARPAGEAPTRAQRPRFCHVHGGCSSCWAAVSPGPRRLCGGYNVMLRCQSNCQSCRVRTHRVCMRSRRGHVSPGAQPCRRWAPTRAGAAAAQVLDKFAGTEFTVEYKYDGERAQVHVLEDGRVAIYRRAAAALFMPALSHGVCA
jgi:hypothetical protein